LPISSEREAGLRVEAPPPGLTVGCDGHRLQPYAESVKPSVSSGSAPRRPGAQPRTRQADNYSVAGGLAQASILDERPPRACRGGGI